MKRLITQLLHLWTKNMNNDSVRQWVVTLIIILLPLLASCSLFSGSWDDGIKFMKTGEVLLKEKKYDESIEAFSKAIAIIENVDDRGNKGHGETLASCYKFRGTAYYNLKNYDKSLADYNKSILLQNAGYGNAYVERGNLFLFKKDFEKAIADFEKALATPYYQDDYRAVLGLVIAHYETQQYEKANQFLSSALDNLRRSEEYPHYDPDDHIKAYEYSIKLSEQEGDKKSAESQKDSLEELKKKHNRN